MKLEDKLRAHCDSIDWDNWWLNNQMYRKKFIDELENIIMKHITGGVKHERSDKDPEGDGE